MQELNRDISILKERILQYLDYKGEKKSDFYKNTGISNGILSQSNGLSEDNLLKFLNYYRDINPNWLLTGIGPMISAQKDHKTTVTTNASPDIISFLREKDDKITSLSLEIYQLKCQVEKLKKDTPRTSYGLVAEP